MYGVRATIFATQSAVGEILMFTDRSIEQNCHHWPATPVTQFVIEGFEAVVGWINEKVRTSHRCSRFADNSSE